MGILAEATPRVIWESGPDKGQSDALNKAFSRSSGDILGWLNSDDAYFSRNAVANVVEVFLHHPEVAVVYGHAALVNGSGTLLYVLWTPPFAGVPDATFNFISQPTAFVRRSAIAREFFVDPAFDYMMDRELWLYLSKRARFHRVNHIVAIDRHHPDRKSYTRPDLAREDLELLREKYHLSRTTRNRLLVRGVHLGIRWAGLTKLREAARGSDIVALNVPSASRIVIRQVAQLRRWMPTG